MNNWNPNEYQGKRKKQVEYSNGVMSICLILTFILLILLIILK